MAVAVSFMVKKKQKNKKQDILSTFTLSLALSGFSLLASRTAMDKSTC